MYALAYGAVTSFIGVSQAVADDLCALTGVLAARVNVIPNAVDTESITASAARTVPHPWFDGQQDRPVVLAAGRLAPQKGFDTLLHAFARARCTRAMRLVILGEGRLRSELAELARTLGVEADTDLPGFVDNPYAYMARADLLCFRRASRVAPMCCWKRWLAAAR